MNKQQKTRTATRRRRASPKNKTRTRTHSKEHVSAFDNYFVRPPPEFARRKAETFQVNRAAIERLEYIAICDARQKVVLHPKWRFDPHIFEIDPFVRYVKPKNLDHLKALAGVTNDAYKDAPEAGRFERCGHGRLQKVEMQHVPTDDRIDFDRLSAPQRQAVMGLATNLLMGYAEPKLMARRPYKAIIDFMLDKSAKLPTFVGKDLLVCPDETVEFAGFSSVYFDNVVVVGNGQIVLGPQTKLHAYQIKHV